MKPAALLAALALSIAGSALAQDAAPDAEIASARPAIEAANDGWIPAMNAHDAASIASAYAEDGLFVLPDGTTIRGKAAIQALMEKRYTPGFKVLGGGLVQDGLRSIQSGLILEWGHGGLTSTDATGKTRTSSGPYMTVWKRDPAGQWKIIRNLVF
jgi:uncharacterized protein (TIGR02246 family)